MRLRRPCLGLLATVIIAALVVAACSGDDGQPKRETG
jgi:hypothetical protein